MPQRIDICASEDVTSGQRRIIEMPDDEVLILNIHGSYYAISNVCPHAGAALERGAVVDNVLFCPLHQWGFHLSTGQSIRDNTICARTYHVITQGDRLYLEWD
jgi:nitrite reductase (NADH) small subunit